MSLSLYHIDQALEALIDPETGELLDYDAFEQLQMDREHKIENMVCWSKSHARHPRLLVHAPGRGGKSHPGRGKGAGGAPPHDGAQA